MMKLACRDSRLRWLLVCGAAGLLAATNVFAGEQSAAAIDLNTYMGRDQSLPARPGAIRLDSGGAAGGQAQVAGSWSASTSTPAMFHRGVSYQSPQINPVGSGVSSGSRTRRVGWRYGFLTAPPAGIHAYLCNYARCVGLSGASGSTGAFDGDNGLSNFVFAFVIDGRGPLTPALQGAAGQILVSYE